jgi:hypothetical protein
MYHHKIFQEYKTYKNIYLPHTASITDKYETIPIYKLTCSDCEKAYTGQIGRSLYIRYIEHIRNIKYNKEDSAYATHIFKYIHQYGKIEDTMGKTDSVKKVI